MDDEVVDRWRAVHSANDPRDLLIDLGVPEDYLAESPDLFTSLHNRGRTINPRYKPRHEAMAALFGLPADALKPDKLARGPRLSARTRMADGVFPDGLDNWLTVLDRARIAKPYQSPRQNREPMPPAVFCNLLAQANQWAKVNLLQLRGIVLTLTETKQRVAEIVLSRGPVQRNLLSGGRSIHPVTEWRAFSGTTTSEWHRRLRATHLWAHHSLSRAGRRPTLLSSTPMCTPRRQPVQ